MDAHGNAAIEARDLVKSYGKVKALDGVSLNVKEGTVFALLGPNGAGKSTTVKIMTTLSRPDSGSVQVLGRDVVAQADGVRRQIGVVGQSAAVDTEATGRENLLLQGAFYGMSGPELGRRVDELIHHFGLREIADR